MAFVIDAHSRRILGWRAATSMRTDMVLEALEMAIWTRGRTGVVDLSGLVNHSDAGAQYTSSYPEMGRLAHHRRLHSTCHDLTPAEYELIHSVNTSPASCWALNYLESPDFAGRFIGASVEATRGP